MSRAANLTRTVAERRSETTRLLRQSIHLDLTGAPDKANDSFESTSTFTLVSSTGEVEIDLVAETAPQVEVDGERIEAVYDESRVQLAVTPDVEHTIVVTAQCQYSHTGEGLHRYFDPEDGETYLYTHFEPTDARRVFPCFDQPDMKAEFSVSVKAPKHWLVRGNGAEETSHVDGDAKLTVFAPTKKQSTYILCVIAGPYAIVEDEWTSADGRTVPLRVMCRPAMRAHLPADDIMRWTKAGLPWCESKFGVDYPWGKYEQIFVPEYNIGAMENPGLVTFNESYLKRGDATRAERERLANTLLHEMAHMWFGDLVTMPWWDDLWLKESFADFIGTQAASEVTEFDDAWLTFGLGRKAWAYAADQLPSTHPIVADIPDVEAAHANFDGITYAKGASVLRQLVAYVGEEAFYAGAAAYFKKHAFGNARLNDLLVELSAASGRDMTSWAQAWLQTAGPDVLTWTGSALERESVDAVGGSAAQRPHRITLTSFAPGETTWVEQESTTLDVSADSTPVELPGGAVLVDDGNWTYAKVRPNEATLTAMTTQVSAIEDAQRRALVWGQLWQLTRDAALPTRAFVDAVLSQLPRESSPAIIDAVMADVCVAIASYLPAEARNPAGNAVWDMAVAAHAVSLEGQDDAARNLALVWRKGLIAAARLAPSADDAIVAILGESGLIRADDDERWSLLASLVAHQGGHDDLVAAQAKRDGTSRGQAQAIAVAAAAPGEAAKAAAWERTNDTTLTNEQVASLVAGLTHPASVADALALAPRYFDELTRWWDQRSQVIATRLARGLFAVVDRPEDADAWLAAHPQAPGALRRVVIEEADQLRRTLRAQEASAAN